MFSAGDVAGGVVVGLEHWMGEKEEKERDQTLDGAKKKNGDKRGPKAHCQSALRVCV